MASSTVTTKQGEALESVANTSSAVATAQAQPLAVGPEVSRRDLDDVRSMRQAATSLTDSLANDHHKVAHTDFQQTVTANITKNQKSLDDAWTKGAELEKSYGKLLALSADELKKPENVTAQANIEKQLKELEKQVTAVVGADHPIAKQFSQQLQMTQDRERAKAVADKLWQLTTDAEMYKGLKQGGELEKELAAYKEQNKDLFARSSTFAEKMKNQETKAREHGHLSRGNAEKHYQEIASSLDHWFPNKAEVAQNISQISDPKALALVQAIYRDQHATKGAPELSDLVKQKVGAQSDAAKSLDAHRNERHIASRLSDESVAKLFSGVNESEFANDPRFAAARQELERLRKGAASQGLLAEGSAKNAASEFKNYEDATKAGLSNFWLTVSGARGSMLESSEASQKLSNDQIQNKAKLELDIREQTKRYEAMVQAESEGRKLQQEGKLVEAQDAFNKAQLSFVDFAKGSGRNVAVVTQDYILQQNAAMEKLDNSQVFMDRSEAALRTTQKVCVIAGATVATIATAGAGAPLLYAAAVGTGAGAGISLASHTVEGTGDVLLANKTLGTAVKDTTVATLLDTKDAAINAAATATGLKAAQAIRGAAEGVTIMRSVAAGSVAGGTTATVATGVTLGGERLAAEYQFKSSVSGKNLTPEQQLLEKTRYMSERGLTGTQMLKTGAINATVGTISGGVGGASMHVAGKIANATQPAVTKVAQQVGVRATETTVNTGLAFGAAYVQNGGHFDLNSTIQILGNAAIGDGLGRSVAAPKTATTASPTKSTTAATTSTSTAQPGVAVPTHESTTITVIASPQTGGNKTTVTVAGSGNATSTGSGGTTTTTVRLNNPTGTEVTTQTTKPAATTPAKAPATETKPATTPAPQEAKVVAAEKQPAPTTPAAEKALPPTPKQVELSAKIADISDNIKSQENWLEFNKKLVAEGKITKEQADPVMKEIHEKIENLKKQQIETQQDLASEKLTQRLLAETQQASRERAERVRLQAENTVAEKERVYQEGLKRQAEVARESQEFHRPGREAVVNEAKRMEASKREIELANRARMMNEASRKPTADTASEPMAPASKPAAGAGPAKSAPKTGGEGSGGQRQVMVAKVTTETELQRTVDGKTVAVPKQKTTYVAVDEEAPAINPKLKQLEKLLSAEPKLSKQEEIALYREIEAKSPAAVDELFTTRRAQNGGSLTKQDVIEVCAKHKIEVPESIQPKATPEIETAQPTREQEPARASKTQAHEELSDDSLAHNYYEIRQAAEHNPKLAAKLDALHESEEFTVAKVTKAFKDAREELPQEVRDASTRPQFESKPWSPDEDTAFNPSRDDEGGVATKTKPQTRQRTSTTPEEETQTQVATRTRPAVEEETRTQSATRTRPAVEEETQTATATRAKLATEEETQTATKTSTKTQTETETEQQLQRQTKRTPPNEPPLPPRSSRRSEDDEGGFSPNDYKRKRAAEEDEAAKRQLVEENKRKEEHAAKRDLVEDKSGDTEGQVFTDPTRYHIEEKGF